MAFGDLKKKEDRCFIGEAVGTAENVIQTKHKFIYMNCIKLAVIHGKLPCDIRFGDLHSGEYQDCTHTHTHMCVHLYVRTHIHLRCKCHVVL